MNTKEIEVTKKAKELAETKKRELEEKAKLEQRNKKIYKDQVAKEKPFISDLVKSILLIIDGNTKTSIPDFFSKEAKNVIERHDNEMLELYKKHIQELQELMKR